MLGRQVASPVQFVKGLHTLYDAGARVFVEVGPKKALQGFVEDVLGDDDGRRAVHQPPQERRRRRRSTRRCAACTRPAWARAAIRVARRRRRRSCRAAARPRSSRRPRRLRRRDADSYAELGAPVRRRPRARAASPVGATARPAREPAPSRWSSPARRSACPGAEQIFDDEQRRRASSTASSSSTRSRTGCAARCSTSTSPAWSRATTATPTFEAIDDRADVIKLAGRAGAFDLARSSASTPTAIAALGRDDPAGHRRRHRRAARRRHPARACTTRPRRMGTQLPDRWGAARRAARRHRRHLRLRLPRPRRLRRRGWTRYYADRARREQLAALEALRARMPTSDRRRSRAPRSTGASHELRAHARAASRYAFDRRFLFRVPVDGPLAVRRAHRRARARTRRSTRRARAPRRRWRWPRTGSAPAAAGGWSSSPPTTPPPTRCCRGSAPASWPPAPRPPTTVVEDAALPVRPSAGTA